MLRLRNNALFKHIVCHAYGKPEAYHVIVFLSRQPFSFLHPHNTPLNNIFGWHSHTPKTPVRKRDIQNDSTPYAEPPLYAYSTINFCTYPSKTASFYDVPAAGFLFRIVGSDSRILH